MDPCEALIERISGRPGLAYKELAQGIRIESPTAEGFAVELHAEPRGWTVYLGRGGFHRAFTSADEVLNFIAWCYSGSARLRELWRGTSPEKSILEANENGAWHPVSETGFLLVHFWRRRTEVILQNPKLLKG